jgi:hypothetical protein
MSESLRLIGSAGFNPILKNTSLCRPLRALPTSHIGRHSGGSHSIGSLVWWRLRRKKRVDRGERRAVSAKVKEVIEGLALQKPPLPIAALYRRVQRLDDRSVET